MKTIHPLLFYAILFLFFFQLLTDFIGAIYAFGLLGTSIPPELAFVLLLFSPALLFLVRRPGPRLLTALLLIILLARVIEPALGTRGRMMLAGAGVAAWLMFFPLLLWRAARRPEADAPLALTAGLLLATLTSALLRALGAGVDISVMGWGQLLGVGLAAAWAWCWLRESVGGEFESELEEDRGGWVMGLTLGMMAGLTLIYFTFAAPYVMARWTGADAFLVLLVMLAAWSFWAIGWVWLDRRAWHKDLLNVAVFLFVLMLFQTINQFIPSFTAAPGDYPLPDITGAPPSGEVFVLFIMLLLSPALFAGMRRLFAAIIARRPSLRQLAAAFALASVFLLAAILAHIFTTTYDYIPVIGPWFRNRFDWVYLAVGIVFLAGVIEAARGPRRVTNQTLRFFPVALYLFMALILGAHWLNAPRLQPAPPKEAITLLTYNIQEGYSASGQKNYRGQLAQIKALHPDIIGLQESDTARIANSNDDVVRYFADHLGMYSYYGPKTVTGTFGVALLSRYPIENAETFFLYSKGEQVAAIEAVIDVGAQPLRVLVTHLGNGGPMIQQQQFLELVGDAPRRTLALGDFNFRPDTPQYALTTQTLLDTWTQKWPDWQDDQGQKPKRKIDHIFISPDLRVLDARYVPEGPSDHPAVTAVVGR